MVNIYKLKLTNLQQEILRVLFIKTNTSLNQRKLAKILKVSPPAVMKALPELKKQNLIKLEQDKESKRWSIELNRSNPETAHLKKVDNLRKIYESELFNFLEKEFAGATIVLFGSYSRGEDTTSSDLDIAVVGRKEKPIDLTEFEKNLERKIIINNYNSFKDIHKNLKENICNGIVLAGGIEL